MGRPRSRARRRPALVTLTSDVGAAYAAQMKAVLAGSLPPGHVIELTHELPAHQVREAAFLLRAMAAPFPAGSVHVAVVDPGVGGRRAPIVIRCQDGSLLVGPDNGVLAPLADALGSPRAWKIDPRQEANSRVGSTFDGRDLFAPVAAQLALGVSPTTLGRPHPFLRLSVPRPARRPGGARGEIVHIDRFGNLITNVPSDWVPRATERLRVRWRPHPPRTVPWVVAYEHLAPRSIGSLPSSFGLVEIARREGRVAGTGDVRVGTAVEVEWFMAPHRARASVRR